jgi:hypothetical protein
MASEPPPGYVAFVERHLDGLRRQAATVVGDEHDADRLYPQVLSDVALRWSWLELQRTALRNAGAADTYLDRAFARESERWQPDNLLADAMDVQVWNDAVTVRPAYTSNAVRLAPLIVPPRPVYAGALCEAAIAWWHAQEAMRRRKWLAAGVVFVVLLALLARFTGSR